MKSHSASITRCVTTWQRNPLLATQRPWPECSFWKKFPHSQPKTIQTAVSIHFPTLLHHKTRAPIFPCRAEVDALPCRLFQNVSLSGPAWNPSSNRRRQPPPSSFDGPRSPLPVSFAGDRHRGCADHARARRLPFRRPLFPRGCPFPCALRRGRRGSAALPADRCVPPATSDPFQMDRLSRHRHHRPHRRSRGNPRPGRRPPGVDYGPVVHFPAARVRVQTGSRPAAPAPPSAVGSGLVGRPCRCWR